MCITVIAGIIYLVQMPPISLFDMWFIFILTCITISGIFEIVSACKRKVVWVYEKILTGVPFLFIIGLVSIINYKSVRLSPVILLNISVTLKSWICAGSLALEDIYPDLGKVKCIGSTILCCTLLQLAVIQHEFHDPLRPISKVLWTPLCIVLYVMSCAFGYVLFCCLTHTPITSPCFLAWWRSFTQESQTEQDSPTEDGRAVWWRSLTQESQTEEDRAAEDARIEAEEVEIEGTILTSGVEDHSSDSDINLGNLFRECPIEDVDQDSAVQSVPVVAIVHSDPDHQQAEY